MAIYICADHWTSRLTYVLDFIFVHVAKIKYVAWSENVSLSDQDIVVVYGSATAKKNNKFIKIPSCGLLNETGIRPVEINVYTDQNRIPYFFNCSDSGDEDYSFDLFSMVFFLLSRYEEYLNPAYDGYGRFCAKNSLAYQNHFLEIPLVDIWVHDLLNRISVNSNIPIKTSTFKIIPTIDVDQVWAFKFKGAKVWLGLIKDLLLFRPGLVRKRLEVFLFNIQDPFLTFERIESLLKKYGKSSRFFILFSKNPSKLDINHHRSNKAFTEFLSGLGKRHVLGIHPSIQSGKGDEILEEEVLALSLLMKKDISASRFHYISFQLPKSYRALVKAGITQDYSMGYPEIIGFRASTGYSFYWYDLTVEEATSLEVYPFQMMDVTLKKYMALDAEGAKNLVQKHINLWKNQTGCIRFIWHNSSFAKEYGWKNWDMVFEWLLSADKLQNEDFNG